MWEVLAYAESIRIYAGTILYSILLISVVFMITGTGGKLLRNHLRLVLKKEFAKIWLSATDPCHPTVNSINRLQWSTVATSKNQYHDE